MKKKQWRVVGKINGIEVTKEFEDEYSADRCAKTLNEVFAPFIVEGIIEEEKTEPIKVASSDGMPF